MTLPDNGRSSLLRRVMEYKSTPFVVLFIPPLLAYLTDSQYVGIAVAAIIIVINLIYMRAEKKRMKNAIQLLSEEKSKLEEENKRLEATAHRSS